MDFNARMGRRTAIRRLALILTSATAATAFLEGCDPQSSVSQMPPSPVPQPFGRFDPDFAGITWSDPNSGQANLAASALFLAHRGGPDRIPLLVDGTPNPRVAMVEMSALCLRLNQNRFVVATVTPRGSSLTTLLVARAVVNGGGGRQPALTTELTPGGFPSISAVNVELRYQPQLPNEAPGTGQLTITGRLASGQPVTLATTLTFSDFPRPNTLPALPALDSAIEVGSYRALYADRRIRELVGEPSIANVMVNGVALTASNSVVSILRIPHHYRPYVIPFWGEDGRLHVHTDVPLPADHLSVS